MRPKFPARMAIPGGPFAVHGTIGAVRGLLKRLRARGPGREVVVPRAVAERAAEDLLAMDEALEDLAQLDGLEEFSRTRRIPERFLPLWRDALRAYDRYVATMIEGSGMQTRCEVGCTACCHDVPTGVQAIELLALYATYRDFPDFPALHDRACDLADVLHDLLHERPPEAPTAPSDDDAYRDAQLAYRRARHPCAFLDDAGRCRVYDDRPIPCRMHFAVTDPSWCWADDPRAADAETQDFAPPRSIVDLMQRIAETMGLGGLSPSLFHGLAAFGGEIMQTERIALRERAKRRRHSKG